MGKNIQNRLQLVLRSVFPSISQDCPDEWGPDEIEDWDSMAHLNLVMAVGEEFGVELDFNEIMGIGTVGDILKIIKIKELQ
mgnify:FL=1